MRPFRNPANVDQYQANREWRISQFNLPHPNRDPDWQWDSSYRIDDGHMMRGMLPDGLIDPWDLARQANRRERGMAPNEEVMRRYRALNLDKLQAGVDIPRDIKLPPFKVDYDSHEQVHQKLYNTVILVKNNPFYVIETAEPKPGEFILAVADSEGNHFRVDYKNVADCRGIAPGYFSDGGAAQWVYRVPERQNRQGMYQQNTRRKPAGQELVSQCRTDFLLRALNNKHDVPYSGGLSQVIIGGGADSLRLSNRVALFKTKKKGAPVGVEYCGRLFGLIVKDECKVLDEHDLQPSWIHKDFAHVNLPLVA
jgi:hypothetical protein